MMTPDEKEAEALRLLEEVARERHGGACVLVRVEYVTADGRTLELCDRSISSAASDAPESSPATACG